MTEKIERLGPKQVMRLLTDTEKVLEKVYSVSCPRCQAPVGEQCHPVGERVDHLRRLDTYDYHAARMQKATLDTTRGRYVVTARGRRVYLADPDPDSFLIDDIAHGLSQLCRYHGQTRFFYSVAQHSCYVASLVPEEHRLAALLHDAAEAYMGDVPQPVKALFPALSDLEDGLMRAICHRFHLAYPLPECVTVADEQVFRAEVPVYCATNFYDRQLEVMEHLPFSLTHDPWEPRRAKDIFLACYRAIEGTEPWPMMGHLPCF